MTTPNDRSVERAAFEKWWGEPLSSLVPGSKASYLWAGWQARATLERAEVGSVVPAAERVNRAMQIRFGTEAGRVATEVERAADNKDFSPQALRSAVVILRALAASGNEADARSDHPKESGESGSTQAGREPLTDEQICKLAAKVVMRANFFPPEDWIAFARAIERALAPSSTPRD